MTGTPRFGYSRNFSAKIIRQKHKIVFSSTIRKIDLMKYLESVPDEATLDDFFIGDGWIELEFHEEIFDKENPNDK